MIIMPARCPKRSESTTNILSEASLPPVFTPLEPEKSVIFRVFFKIFF
jgi:hypothetical protein